MINFSKYQGTGNDFVVIDNRQKNIELSIEQVKLLCNRKFGIGADGLMLLQEKKSYDFEMIYYNADGNIGSMCGNGGRCLTQFAFDCGIKKEKYKFIASDGEHESFFADNRWIHLKMKDVDEIENHHGEYVLNTGSPHYVKTVNSINEFDVFKEGREIRYSKDFEENGINVNFVEQTDEDNIYVRTYERGVEDETLSCGTGVTASALVFYHNEVGFNRIEVETLGGKLAVEFDKTIDDKFENIWLCGAATFVFNGTISL
jgi:diaminopimelate epimerase